MESTSKTHPYFSVDFQICVDGFMRSTNGNTEPITEDNNNMVTEDDQDMSYTGELSF